jgi:hypothetical protein
MVLSGALRSVAATPLPASGTGQFAATACVWVNAPQVVVTVAVNWTVPPAVTVVELGDTLTDTTLSVTVTVAVWLLVGSAWLVATTWYVPPAAGAV